MRVQATSTATVAIYTFYIMGEIAWGQDPGAHVFTDLITLFISCTPTSATILEEAFPGSFTSTQVVQAANADSALPTHFVFPGASSDVALCPIEGFRVVDEQNLAALQSASFSSPAGITSPVTGTAVAPVDINADKDYTFYIVWIAKGGKEKISSTPMNLYVGCTATMGITDPNFVGSAQIGIGDSGQEVYTINPPQSDRSYCPIIKYEVIDVEVAGVASPGAAFLSASCNGSPTCTKVDISTTSTSEI
jgi:hypothetical protein